MSETGIFFTNLKKSLRIDRKSFRIAYSSKMIKDKNYYIRVKVSNLIIFMNVKTSPCNTKQCLIMLIYNALKNKKLKKDNFLC